MTKTTQPTVRYAPVSHFFLDFDLSETSEWYVRRDTLFVKHSENDEWVQYEADCPAEDDADWNKHPMETSIHVE